MEVHRVCKVIDETFAVDRNMEAVLNECGVNLSHDLVLSVLERYKLARKPAFRFFCWASTIPGFDHDPQTFNAMLGILGQSRQFETVQSLLNEMRDKGMLNIESFTICIRAFAAAKERRKAVGIIDLMKKCSFKVDAEIINCLLHSLCREKLGKEALLLFRKLEHKFTPDSRTYTILLSGWCRVRNLMEAGRIWNEMIDAGFHPDVIAHNTMIEGLIRGRKRSDAIKLFHVMKSKGPSPDVKTYTAIISDLCKRRDRRLMNEAVDYFNEMKSCGLKPDAAIYTRLLQGFGYLDELDAVYDVLADMDENGCIPDGHTYNALIKMMVNRRMPDDAVKIYERMIGSGVEPSIHTYNMIMKSYFVVKDYETGMRTWEEMKLKGCCADENSYTVLIGSLLRLGKWSEACRYLEEMIEKGMRAPQFGRKMEEFRGAEIDTLQILIEKMKYKGNTEVADVLSRWLDHNSSKGMFSAFGK
ncbi:hypothetical protein M569_02938 [Genlisea aurea]|uniref:Pentacotripeptide-repeat region of PRORP domain-containing protein n=1 Tax=Genlisea aurea TaxID=192259 RepID=S8E7H2_9LAMI|nr:hypothetical protein M569_02938 [Genlisea aurea]